MPRSWRACARRWRRAVCAGTARTSACKTIGGAGMGPTTSASHWRGAGCQVARPVSRRSCRRTKALRRHVASVRARRASARARVRARIAAAATVGTETTVRAPERARRARCTASLRCVLTRSLAFWGSSEGATPQQAEPFGVRERESQEPHGPAAETKSRGVAFDGLLRRRGSMSHGRGPMAPTEVTSAPGVGATYATSGARPLRAANSHRRAPR